jgi:hypothetical protein
MGRAEARREENMRLRSLAFVAVLAAAGAVSAEVRVGDVREAQARAGIALREGPSGVSKLVKVLPHATRMTVQEVKGTVARVLVVDGSTGWVKSNDLVAPGTLTSVKPAGGATVASSADISAAGRQFDEAIEGEYRATHAQLETAYRLLDALEAKTPKPGDPAIEAFIAEGRLGR